MLNHVAQAAHVTHAKIANWPGWLPIFVFPAAAIFFTCRMAPWIFMWTLSFAIFAALKWMTWWRARWQIEHSGLRSAAYLLAWPGMDAEAFLTPAQRVGRPQARQWLWAWLKTVFGVLLLWIIARRISSEQPLLRGWIGLFGLVFILHFGTFQLIALFWQAMGIHAEPIMSKPILSKTLSEFWGKRWNLGFRQLAHDFIFSPLHGRIGVTAAGLVVFAASGLIHDLVISLPAHGGYGLPTAYFMIQGLGVAAERAEAVKRLGLQSARIGRVFVIAVTAAPAFWLFHPAFISRVIIPFMHAIHSL
jgi:hypothetical protein